MRDFAGKPVRVFVVWEPVLSSDWGSPSAATLGRIPDPRAMQFWDKDRLISHSMGEHDRKSVVWDQIMVYGAGTVWMGRPPKPLYQGRPVIQVADAARAALWRVVAH
ncbi:MAG TPA: hypothetical protein VLW65_13560 [Bryobacteraceae bacterium]|nr:hypothetical protein [Bryobacteraceae bacterium]